MKNNLENINKIDDKIIKWFKIEIDKLIEKNRRLKSYFFCLLIFFIIILLFIFWFFYVLHKKIIINNKILKNKNETLVLENKKLKEEQKKIENDKKNLKQIISELNDIINTYFIYLNWKLVKIDKKKLEQLENNWKIKQIYDKNWYIFIEYNYEIIKKIENFIKNNTNTDNKNNKNK